MDSISKNLLISAVVPCYNEAKGLPEFHHKLLEALKNASQNRYEIIYCDDGSSDDTAELVSGFHQQDQAVKLIKLSRNFGKENALAAGIAQARGEAIIMLDGDGQHPPELIAEFVEAWKNGAKVVVGVRADSKSDSSFKRRGSKIFYKIFNRLANRQLVPGSTDFRLIDRAVQQAFLTLGESDRITRGLINWLGFKRAYIHFKAHGRTTGSAGYSNRKLMRLATNSFVSFTPLPLYIFGYLGLLITSISLLLGIAVLIEQIILGDPWHWNFTGTAILSILLLFLVGILLISQGILSLYVSHIHSQSKARPLYIVDTDGSVGIKGT